VSLKTAYKTTLHLALHTFDSFNMATHQLTASEKTMTAALAYLIGLTKPGSRQPTKYPKWLTLEVAQGGFATGRLTAALRSFDKSSRLYLEPEGMRELLSMLETGAYDIQDPENAALLIVAWLMKKDKVRHDCLAFSV